MKPQDGEREKLVGRIAERARRGRKGAAAASAEAFVRAYYARLPLGEFGARKVDDLAAEALSFLDFGETRKPGKHAVRVFNTERDDNGERHDHSIVEIVNDNMPFLVDSVTMALNAQDLGVEHVVHPIVKVLRDGDGRLKGIAGAVKPAKAWREYPESFIHVEVDRQIAGKEVTVVRQAIERALTDVQRSVKDWLAMRGKLSDVVNGLSSIAGKDVKDGTEAGSDVSEVHDFLKWLDDDHFTFLGYRRYDFVAKNGTVHAKPVPRTALGILREADTRVFYANESRQPRDVTAMLERDAIVTVAKSNHRSTVHRPALIDTVSVRIVDDHGNVVGEHLFVGLFTSHAYNLSPRFVPLIRRKVNRCVRRAGFDASSHDGKALLHILETYPRDELFQISEDELYEAALGIMHLHERQRTALFMRRDPFGRFISCLVFTPKEVYSSKMREKFEAILCAGFAGTVSAFYPHISDEPLARIHFVIRTDPSKKLDADPETLEKALAAAARSWPDELRDGLIGAHGERRGLALFGRYGDAFPASYSEAFTVATGIDDLLRIDAVLESGRPGVNLYRRDDAEADEIRLKIYHADHPLPLSDVLPVLENMGLKVIEEIPFRITPKSGGQVWIHDFGLVCRCEAPGGDGDFATVKALFEEALLRIQSGHLENDGYNQLVLAEGLGWREVSVVRAYSKYLRQVRVPFSQDYMIETFVRNPGFARMLVDLFAARFDPADRSGANARMETLKVKFAEALDAVANLDEDRILRRFLNVAGATLRTNHYQTDADGEPKPCLALKLASAEIEELPLPRPWREIWVYSPRLEGIHLRGGPVARGGIRWSDRREDFRTEILGLMKAQTIKNPVIVPVGAKGGFVLKRPPEDGGREAMQAEGIACYKTFIRGLLDVTDNRSGDKVIVPKNVIRHDDDDPYLVVAADKGTATFSDIANGISRDEYGFWLDDAFASGGSVGYDHKKMGITARGAWESVKRHFRELGKDIQSQDFTCVGVGDMAGDVFGNGMLLSPHTKLVAAFNHLHIFIDPDPDPEKSLNERRRLFETPRSTWMDYDKRLISRGGGVFDRKAKSVSLSAEIQNLLGVGQKTMAPDELVRRLLMAEVELLWFGGIGTFVKSSRQSDLDAGDRNNDSVRVDAGELRCKVIGEGANLGVTQLARVEYARAGGRINTDSIDNSAGVDTSDHEVNIKILLGQAVQSKKLSMTARDKLLADMTDEVAALVLRDNYLQTQALSVAESEAAQRLPNAQRLIRGFERAGRINRVIDGLPDDETLAERGRSGEGLTRPEMAVLLAHAKLSLNDDLMATDLPDEPIFEKELVDYFPTPVRKDFKAQIPKHRLNREIIVTALTNQIVNRAGFTFVSDMKDRTGQQAGTVARAFEIARQIFECDDLWRDIEALDNKVAAEVQADMLRHVQHLLERTVVWFLENGDHPLDLEANIEAFRPCIRALAKVLPDVISKDADALLTERRKALCGAGVGKELARRIAGLPLMGVALDIVSLSESDERSVPDMARVYFGIGARFGFDWLRQAAQRIDAQTQWQRQAVQSLVDELNGLQHDLVAQVIDAAGEASTVEAIVEVWAEKRKAMVARTEQTISDIQSVGTVDLAMITVAVRQLRVLVAG